MSDSAAAPSDFMPRRCSVCGVPLAGLWAPLLRLAGVSPLLGLYGLRASWRVLRSKAATAVSGAAPRPASSPPSWSWSSLWPSPSCT